MDEQLSRTALLLGDEALARLRQCRVAVFGLGGVGSWAAEALCRSGVGALDLVDDDRICASNLNRQLLALHSTLGQSKVQAAARRLADIAPECRIRTHSVFFLPETAGQFDFAAYDYVVDAIDTVTGKIELVLRAQAAGVPVISAMGTGNKLNPGALRIADVYETAVCPLARVMRRELRRRGVQKLKVVYSEETPIAPRSAADSDGLHDRARRSIPGSAVFVPAAAGLMIAAEVVRELATTGGKGAIQP